MYKIFKKIRLPEISLFFGVTSFSYLLYVKRQFEHNIDHVLIQETMNYIKNEEEVLSAFGYEYRIDTDLYSALRSSVKFDGPYGEATFKVKTPSGKFDVTVNLSNQTYSSIINSNKPKLFKAKFRIPDPSILSRLPTEEDPEKQKAILIPQDAKFWSIDFISVSDRSFSYIRKPSSQLVFNERDDFYSSMFSIVEFYNNSKNKFNKKLLAEGLSEDQKSRILHYRVIHMNDARVSFLMYTSYFFFVFSIYYALRVSYFKVSSIKNTFLEKKAHELIQNRFNNKQSLVFNKTSVGGIFFDTAKFTVQFSTNELRGNANFEAYEIDKNHWGFSKAELLYNKDHEKPIHEDFFNFVNVIEVRNANDKKEEDESEEESDEEAVKNDKKKEN